MPATSAGFTVVFGGGGATGNAWTIGVVAGLAEGGFDVTTADLTVGTSSGATAAAQLVGADPKTHFDAIVSARRAGRPGGGPTAGPTAGGQGGGRSAVADHLARLRAIIDASESVDDFRRRMGSAALEREDGDESAGSWTSRWHETTAARLPGATWPDRRVVITAIDARTGEPALFERDGGVSLVDAVAASTSSGLPYRVDGLPYLDGGFRRNENADLAAGSESVLVLSPLGGRTLHPLPWRTRLDAQVDDLLAGGSRVEVVVPGDDAQPLIGEASTNLSLRPAAARAGFEQGRALAERLGNAWAGR
ncbi:patatin-like phospholipase family protein [Frondihabitans australicus]|uniref:NTE family protein n=1 Tax=Frondihabitans australicus TaxID=386892 RepID=A0A495II79_9MICO|nr:patatin-like phospholipase family protein [Frondihabitans australicus]RKR75118.1 NTE family protein [Frondihabitans australicus]